MAREEALKDKIMKLGSKQKLSGVLKYINHPSDEVRVTVAVALGMIPTYESGMGLISLLRDQSTIVRSSACEAAAKIKAKHCEQYVKKLAFADPDPDVRQIAKRAFDQLKDPVIT